MMVFALLGTTDALYVIVMTPAASLVTEATFLFAVIGVASASILLVPNASQVGPVLQSFVAGPFAWWVSTIAVLSAEASTKPSDTFARIV